MLAAGMVQHQIQNYPDAHGLTVSHQSIKILHGAIVRINGVVVGYIVLVISGAGVDGHEPQTGDPQLPQVGQLLPQTVQVSDAVAVGVTVGVYEYLIPDPVIVVRALPQSGDLPQGFFCPLGGGRCGFRGDGFCSRERGFCRLRNLCRGCCTSAQQQKCQYQAQHFREFHNVTP